MIHPGGTSSKVVLGMFAMAMVLGSCMPKEKFPPQPSIKFESFEQTASSAKLTISFTDGDGDIGLDVGDNQPPYDADSPYYHNLFLVYEELRDGEWVQPDLLIENNFRIPRITPTGQNKTLQGEIAVDLFWPLNDPNSGYDTTRFQVQLLDRALNESNLVYTENIIVP